MTWQGARQHCAGGAQELCSPSTPSHIWYGVMVLLPWLALIMSRPRLSRFAEAAREDMAELVFIADLDSSAALSDDHEAGLALPADCMYSASDERLQGDARCTYMDDVMPHQSRTCVCKDA